MSDSAQMAFFMNLGKEIEKSDAPSPRDTYESSESCVGNLTRQLSELSSVFGSGILDLGDPNPKNFPPQEFGKSRRSSFFEPRSRTSSLRPLDEGKTVLGSPPTMGGLAGSRRGSFQLDLRDMSATQSKTVERPEPAPLMQRSRSGSGASKSKYVPPKGRYSGSGSSESADYKQWMEWDNQELEKRKRALIGKTVVGKLSPQRGNRYFVKWNINANDTIVISADKVEEVLGETAPAGMWVSCTIVGLGPGHVAWNKQHPYAMTLESRETRASHQPNKGKMPRNSSHWKKAQKAGLSKPVVKPISSRQTVPAEIDMARYVAGRRPVPTVPETLPNISPLSRSSSVNDFNSPPPAGSILSSLPLTDSLPEGVVLEPTVVPPNDPNETFGTRINGANINLVTGEIRRRGRAESAGSWRKRDRSFTV